MAKFPTGRGTETSKMLPKEQHLADIIVRLTKSWDEERRGQLVAVAT